MTNYPTGHKLRVIDSDDVYRIVELCPHLGAIDFASIPFAGFDKHSQRTFRYGLGHVMPPEHLFFCGQNPNVLNADLSVALGGTVSPCEEAFGLSQHLAKVVVEFGRNCEGAIVVSGGAFGIDMAAHMGALNVGGRTVAVVIATPVLGLESTMPENALIEREIIRCGGGFVSEYNDQRLDSPWRYQERDRIIAALADIFIVIEAKANSGSVDTAKRAKIQGRRVYVMDWTKMIRMRHSPRMDGFHQLIKEEIAIPFPAREFTDVRGEVLTEQFWEILVDASRERKVRV